MTTTRMNHLGLVFATFVLSIVALFVGTQLLQPTVADAQVPTYPFKLTKSISDNYTPDPYTADEFKFNVSGYGIVNLTEYTDDTAEAIVYLPAGTHTVEEVGPAGFNPADWTLQWSGPGCETLDDGNGPVRPIEITVVETSVDYPLADDVGNACKADNQWRPVSSDPVLGCTNPNALNYNPAATEDDGSCDLEEEVVLGCTDVTATNYNPSATVGNPNATNCEYDNGPQCTAELSGSWADAVVSSNQTDTKADGDITNPDRTDATKALGAEDWAFNGNTGFFSLGFGGSIILSFDSYVPNVAGTDLMVYEATNGDTYPAETATVEVSQNGTTWILAGTANNAMVPDRTSAIDFDGTGLNWITHVRITDTSNPALHSNDADGFDLDAVKATQQVCDEPGDNGGGDGETYTIEGYKWHDTDGDGVKDIDEAYIVGWEINAEKVGAIDSYVTTLTDANGFYSFTVSAGTWVVGEEYREGWTQRFPISNEGTCSLMFAGLSSTQSCNFGNENINDEEEPKYLVFGYVWHDENENDAWEQEQPNPADDESDLDGWTVQITDGVHTYATTTDVTGYYYFHVGAGTWTIKEIVEEGWDQTFPNEAGVHVVEVLGEVTLGEETNFFAMVMDFVVPTAHAAVMPTTYGPYNFGNVQEDGGDGDGGGGSNGGGGGGGNGRNPSLRDGGGSSNSNDNDDEPEGQVLGEATSIMPVGAPNTGAGGTSPLSAQLPTLTAILSLSTSVRKVKNG